MVLLLENIDFVVYNFTMNEQAQILILRDQVIKAFKGKIDDFALGGGTALALVYFQHRDSYDLDFFTKDFSSKRISEVMDELSKNLAKKVKHLAQSDAKS